MIDNCNIRHPFRQWKRDLCESEKSNSINVFKYTVDGLDNLTVTDILGTVKKPVYLDDLFNPLYEDVKEEESDSVVDRPKIIGVKKNNNLLYVAIGIGSLTIIGLLIKKNK